MPRYTLTEYDTAVPATRDVYDDFMRATGATELPVWIKILGHSPSLTRACWKCAKGTLLRGNLPLPLKEMIIFVVSSLNGREVLFGLSCAGGAASGQKPGVRRSAGQRQVGVDAAPARLSPERGRVCPQGGAGRQRARRCRRPDDAHAPAGAQALLKRADEATYRAKADGRNCIRSAPV